MSGKQSPVNPLELRKQLLIAESEINRTHLLQDGETIASGVRSMASKARSISSVASIAGLLATGFFALRSNKTNSSDTTKSSWFRKAFNGVKTLVPLWVAFRRGAQKGQHFSGERTDD